MKSALKNLSLKKTAVLALTAFLLASTQGHSATLYWTTPSGTWLGGIGVEADPWSTAPAGAPSATWVDGDSASIVASNPTIRLYNNVSANILTVTDGLTLGLRFNGNRSLTVSGGGSGNITLAGAPLAGISSDTALNQFLSGTSGWEGTLQANFSNGTTNQGPTYTTLNRFILNNATATGLATKVVLNGGVLALNTGLIGNTAVIGELSGVAGSLITTFNNGANNSVRGLRVEQSTHTTYAGSIQGNNSTGSNVIALTKAGAGRLRLTGNNNYSSATNVNAGSLYVNGTTSGQGSYSIKNGATLGGNGVIGLAGSSLLTVEDGGILDPGDISDAGVVSAGTLLISGAVSGAGLQFLGDATLQFNLNTDALQSDQIVLGGSTMAGSALGGEGSVAFRFLADDASSLVGNTFNLVTFGTTPGISLNTFALSSENTLAGWNATFQWNNKTLQVNIHAVPEPSTIGLIAAGFFVLLVCLQRRRKPFASPMNA